MIILINSNSKRSWVFCSQSLPVFLAVVVTAASMCCFRMKINVLEKWFVSYLHLLSHASIDVTHLNVASYFVITLRP